jgi:very-short-patch-repair endonuclease
MSSGLPQICIECRQLKAESLGRYFKIRSRHNVQRFICSACDEKENLPRLNRRNDESVPERIVRMAVSRLGFEAYAEFLLGPFIYDFAFPKLRLLIEIDSRRWHRGYSRKQRDKRKSAYAADQGWALVRLDVGENLDTRAELAVRNRASQLGM